MTEHRLPPAGRKRCAHCKRVLDHRRWQQSHVDHPDVCGRREGVTVSGAVVECQALVIQRLEARVAELEAR